jgi:hypothetical protein
MTAFANNSGVAEGTIRPERSFSMISRTPPTSVATQARLHIMASIKAFGDPSVKEGQCEYVDAE